MADRAAYLAYRFASADDCELLGAWNKQLIDDEGHDNPMSVRELADRMRGWLAGEYHAVIFEQNAVPVAYALFRDAPEWIHLRQFFVVRDRRRRGIGASALALLQEDVFSPGRRIFVEAMERNRAGLSFWRNVGFVDRYVGLVLSPAPQAAG
jgi:GNAT superfamily N-acetyltransferase